MSISVQEGSEFSVMGADMIETLASLEMFELNIWLIGVELPFTFESHCDFHFMTEGIRITDGQDVMYVLFEHIIYVRVINESKGLAT